jgi:hypothetical protein
MLAAMQHFDQYAKQTPEYMINYSAEEGAVQTGIYGNNIIAGAAYRKCLEEAKEAENTPESKNPLADYQTYVVTHDGKMLVEYAECYGIVDGASSDQIIACKRFLYLMMQQRAQIKKNSYSSETVFPIRVEQLQNFSTINRKMESFVSMYSDLYPCEMLGALTGNMQEFIRGLNGITDKSQLQNYCSSYTNPDVSESTEAGEDAEPAAEEEASTTDTEADQENTEVHEE